jgi:hypothetical protein
MHQWPPKQTSHTLPCMALPRCHRPSIRIATGLLLRESDTFINCALFVVGWKVFVCGWRGGWREGEQRMHNAILMPRLIKSSLRATVLQAVLPMHTARESCVVF